MTNTHEEHDSHRVFSLTRMIYAVCSAIILYKLLERGGWFLLTRKAQYPRFDLWVHAANLFFVLTMLAVSLAYRPMSELVRWSSPRSSVGIFGSIGSGLVGGVVAFAFASPISGSAEGSWNPYRCFS